MAEIKEGMVERIGMNIALTFFQGVHSGDISEQAFKEVTEVFREKDGFFTKDRVKRMGLVQPE